MKKIIVTIVCLIICACSYLVCNAHTDVFVNNDSIIDSNGWENEPAVGDTIMLNNENIDYIIYDNDNIYIIYSDADINCFRTKLKVTKTELGILLTLTNKEYLYYEYRK